MSAQDFILTRKGFFTATTIFWDMYHDNYTTREWIEYTIENLLSAGCIISTDEGYRVKK